ncbi:MAG: adenosylmethionine decarboxylase [Polyangiaceae bacterium]
MILHVGLAILEGVDPRTLDDPEAMRACLERAVEAGAFSLRELSLVRFTPHGVTGAAIVGESHLAIHTWPEEGRLFVDIASCAGEARVHAAIDAITQALAGARVAELELRTLGARVAEAHVDQ